MGKKKQSEKPKDCDGEHYFVDGVDREIQRPKNTVEQEANYSEKHRKHGVKNTFISNEISVDFTRLTSLLL